MHPPSLLPSLVLEFEEFGRLLCPKAAAEGHFRVDCSAEGDLPAPLPAARTTLFLKRSICRRGLNPT